MTMNLGTVFALLLGGVALHWGNSPPKHFHMLREIGTSFNESMIASSVDEEEASAQVPTAEEVARSVNGKIISRKTSNTYRSSLNRGYASPFSASLLAEAEKCQPDEMSCEDDKLTVCGIGNVKITIPCSSLFDKKPGFCDCDKTQCVSTRPQCAREEDNKCDRKGEKLPDPKDCRIFTYCDGTKKAAIKCPPGFNYNPAKQSCEQGGVCHPLRCGENIMDWIPFPQAPKYYLFCMYGQGEVRQCTQEGYTMQNKKCQFQCVKSGLFKDPLAENCKKGIWYSCASSKNNVFTKQKNYCGKVGDTQLYFNEEIGLCTETDTCGSSPGPDNNNNGGQTTERPTTTSYK